MRLLAVTLLLKMESMSPDELEASGVEMDEEEGFPSVSDYSPRDIAKLIPDALMQDEIKAEVFAGSDVLLNLTDVTLVSCEWCD